MTKMKDFPQTLCKQDSTLTRPLGLLMGDYMFFGPPGSQGSSQYRQMFLDHFRQDPPKVMVVTTARLGLNLPDSFDKINQWPEFVELLNSDYTLDVTRMPDPDNSRGYRIYLLKPEARAASLP